MSTYEKIKISGFDKTSRSSNYKILSLLKKFPRKITHKIIAIHHTHEYLTNKEGVNTAGQVHFVSKNNTVYKAVILVFKTVTTPKYDMVIAHEVGHLVYSIHKKDPILQKWDEENFCECFARYCLYPKSTMILAKRILNTKRYNYIERVFYMLN